MGGGRHRQVRDEWLFSGGGEGSLQDPTAYLGRVVSGQDLATSLDQVARTRTADSSAFQRKEDSGTGGREVGGRFLRPHSTVDPGLVLMSPPGDCDVSEAPAANSRPSVWRAPRPQGWPAASHTCSLVSPPLLRQATCHPGAAVPPDAAPPPSPPPASAFPGARARVPMRRPSSPLSAALLSAPALRPSGARSKQSVFTRVYCERIVCTDNATPPVHSASAAVSVGRSNTTRGSHVPDTNAHGPGLWTSKIKVPARLVSSESTTGGLHTAFPWRTLRDRGAPPLLRPLILGDEDPALMTSFDLSYPRKSRSPFRAPCWLGL